MLVNLELADADDSTESSTPLRSVPASRLQRGMLLYLPDADQVTVIIDDPEEFQQEGDHGRVERWVHIPVLDSAEPMLSKGGTRLEIVVGTPPELLQPMPPSDLLEFEEEALAFNGLCHEQIPETPDPEDDPDDRDNEEEDLPLWCALPSDPNSPARLCTAHNQARQQESDELVGRGFQPIYGG